MNESLPSRSAMHRDDPKGSRLEIANAYAVGWLIDGQAIKDVWTNQPGSGFREYVHEGWPELATQLNDLCYPIERF